MIPVTQTKVVVRNSKDEIIVHGNCYAAAIASILELPITEVPNVEILFNIEGVLWCTVMQTFINSLGYELCTNNQFKVFHDEEYTNIYLDRAECIRYCTDKYYLVSGKSARGVNHICIYKNGIMVHDPHPTREGILTLEIF